MGGKDILLKRTKKQKTRTKKRTKNQEKKQIGVSVKMDPMSPVQTAPIKRKKQYNVQI